MESFGAYDECVREFEKDRNESARLLSKRKNEVYDKIPRIREIDESLSLTAINISKQILSGDSQNAERLIAGMEKENNRLIKEKNLLLKENGFKQNFLTDIYKCRLCRDTGYVDNEKCRCFSQKLISRYYDLSNINNILKKENFGSFNLKYYSDETDPQNGLSPRANIQKIHKICAGFAADFDSKYANLLFYGPTGLGKTFLCNAVAKELLDAGKTVLYITASQLFKMFDDYRFRRDEMDEPDAAVEMVFKAELLIIDDLGTEFTTGNSLSEFFSIVNQRILEQRPMIISTNLNPNDFEAIYTERIVSRLIGSFIMCKFFGQDIRVFKKYRKEAT